MRETLSVAYDMVLHSLNHATGIESDIPWEREAHSRLMAAFEDGTLCDEANETEEDMTDDEVAAAFEPVTYVTTAFGWLISAVEETPRSADRSAALRCARIGLFAAQAAAAEDDEAGRKDLYRQALDNARAAKWQAEAAADGRPPIVPIALHGGDPDEIRKVIQGESERSARSI